MSFIEECHRYDTDDHIFIIVIDRTRTEIRITDQELADEPTHSIAWLLTKKYLDQVRDGTARGEKLSKEFLKSKLWHKLNLSSGG